MAASSAPSPYIGPERPGRILIVRPSAFGDVCRTVPVLVSLKRAFPDAKIDWLVQDSFAPAIAHHPDLSRVLLFQRRRLGSWHSPAIAGELWRFLRALRESRYDLVLDCQGLARSAFFTWSTRAPTRIGFANAGELGWLALTRRVPAPRTIHAVDRMLKLVEAAGCEAVRDLRLYSSPMDQSAVARLVGGAGTRYAVFAPTTRWAGKLWPGERFAGLAGRLLDDKAFGIEKIAVVGSGAERGQCAELLDLATRDARIVDLVGRTSAGELLALIEGSRLTVGSDSAAIHIAVGFSRPLVALFGPTLIDLVGPYGRAAHVVQQIVPGDTLDYKNEAAGRVLMNRITVESVLECAFSQVGERTETLPKATAAV